MNKLKYFITLLLIGVFTTASMAHKPFVPDGGTPNPNNNTNAGYRMDCAESTSQTDLNINNVRARLLGGGDQWWDFDDARYIVPNVAPGSGLPEVSAIYAGAVWMGGFDDGNNLKMAAQTYRSSTRNDFWPGPLQPGSGEVTEEECLQWDKHFEVLGADIEAHLKDFQKDGSVDCENVPLQIRGWPGRGNPHFPVIHGFDLPNQELAPFFDENGDGLYDPCDGDFPIIEMIGCETTGEASKVSYADQMVWWVFNDNGGIHTRTTGDPIRMEIHALAFSYKTGDEVNDMTFYRYKMINRANQSIDSTFFAQWVDGDLGCFTDDFIGSDTSRSLAILYNDGTPDGAGGCGSTPTYGDKVPLLGIDYFRGPKDEFGKELGMSSFVYYANGGFPGLPATGDPATGQQFYNYLSGSWRDGSPFTLGGDGYDPTGIPTNYVFPDDPSNPNGWSMCTEDIDGADLRTVQASGPFRLEPGAINELIIGVTFVPDILYPCPSFQTLLTADDLAQALYDNCFKITDGPDAPSMDIVELDQELVILLSNDSTSNNFKQLYAEKDLQAPELLPSGGVNTDTLYHFEGYKVYQLASSSFSDLDDPAEARLIFQVDLNNGVDKIYNWIPFPGNAAAVPVFTPELMIDGGDQGILSSFKVTEDQFAEGDRGLVNHKKYYFIALAYAYNNWQAFDPTSRVGQRTAYLEGRRNVEVTTGIPRITQPEFGGMVTNATYGDGVPVTRLDGWGTSRNFLDITDETRDEILANNSVDRIGYKNGAGPIDVKIVDPLRAYPGVYKLTIFDEDLSNNELDDVVEWMLEDPDGDQWFSESTLDVFNEQLIMKLDVDGQSVTRGISVTVGQVAEAGEEPDGDNGFIGAEAIFKDPLNEWFIPVAPTANFATLNYVQVGPSESDFLLDPQRIYSNVLSGAWVPYGLTNAAVPPTANGSYLSPMWSNNVFSNVVKANAKLESLNNVDIVITSDKSKWSRCVVVETANPLHTGEGWSTIGNATNMDLRKSPSVDKDGNPDNTNTEGMGWFPGYAIDVETGERLNIFFGENSIYSEEAKNGFGALGLELNGGDMIWNPTSEAFVDADGSGTPSGIYEFVFGQQHFIYVHRTTYDECADIFTKMNSGAGGQVQSLRDVTWTSFPISSDEFLSPADGLITNDVTFKLRVQNPFQVSDPKTTNNGYPEYEFTLDGQAPTINSEEQALSALDLINVVPNPYFAYSAYEVTQLDNTVKITNLPPECTVTIYSLDGRFIRQYKRAEDSNKSIAAQGMLPEQIRASIDWDLKNSKGIPIAGGVYLIHVDAPGLGERVVKWFGITRTFDTSGL